MFATTASSTNLFTTNLSINNFTGFLKAAGGVVATSLVNLAADVTGVLPATNGGTGWAAVQAGTLLYGNGTGALSTTTAGTAGQVLALLGGVPTWTASTTFSSGLAYLNGNVTNTGVLAIGPTNQTQNGTVTIATSTDTNLGLTITGSGNTLTFTTAWNGALADSRVADNLTINGGTINSTPIGATGASTGVFTNSTSTNLFASFVLANTASFGSSATSSFASNGALTLAQALTVANGGTGATTFSYGLVGSNGGTGALTTFATSSLGLTTSNVAEGSNLYYQNSRVLTYLNTFDKGYFFSTTSVDYWKSATNFFSTTSASYFAAQGLAFSTTSSAYFLSVNQGAAFSTTSADYYTNASSTIPKTYTNNTFTGANIFATFLATGSSTLQNFTGINATTTNATSTSFFATVASTTSALVQPSFFSWATTAAVFAPSAAEAVSSTTSLPCTVAQRSI